MRKKRRRRRDFIFYISFSPNINSHKIDLKITVKMNLMESIQRYNENLEYTQGLNNIYTKITVGWERGDSCNPPSLLFAVVNNK